MRLEEKGVKGGGFSDRWTVMLAERTFKEEAAVRLECDMMNF